MAKATLTIKLDLTSANAAALRAIARALADDPAPGDIAALITGTLRAYIASLPDSSDDYDLSATVTAPKAGRPGRRTGADSIPVVRNDTWQLYDPHVGRVTQRVKVGGRHWLSTLEQEKSFRYESKAGTFTASKESSGKWYARRSIGGKLKKVYLGKSEALTAKKLWNAAHKLSQLELPTGGGNDD